MISKKAVIISTLFTLTLLMPALVLAQSSCAISKWIQLPDETKNGIDIRMDRVPGAIPRTLADDFLCEQTGPITCVKFWGSWYRDNNAANNSSKGQLDLIHLSIHSDVPAVFDAAGVEIEHSHPGNLLWEWEFGPSSFTEALHLDLCPDSGNPDTCSGEGFWDPTGESTYGLTYIAQADFRIWQYTVEIPTSLAFVQEGTAVDPIVYWLDIYVVINGADGVDREFGWKTSIDHFNDNAVFDIIGTGWAELIYPPGNSLVDQDIDLAFEINTSQDIPPTEACCYKEINADGSVSIICADLTVADCLAKNGIPQGVGTDCTTTPCEYPPPPTEACCLPDGSCINTLATGCQALGGSPQGPGSDCSTADCNKCVPTVITCPTGLTSVGSSFLGGAIDNFAPFAEPATPDALLLNYITSCTSAPGYALQFDELPGVGGVSANSWFGHTFTSLPSGIVGATLEIRARATPGAGGGLSWNDSLGFIDTISGCVRTDLWANRFSNLPEAGGTWTSGQAATFCLDLDNLPVSSGGTTSIISDLASGRLSLWAQDDTGIDYMLLNIMVCPCKYPFIITYTVEIADNFAAPDSAPASPSSEITGFFTNLKGFDDFTPNRAFVHTFTSLPPNIIGGSLQIGLKAHAGNSLNDSLNLEFLNPSFRWGRAISSLAPTGLWAPPTSKVITLDLANLPISGSGVTSVIADMADGDLDVYVQDDTAVDYLILKVKVCCDEGIPGDLDNDGDVDLADVSILMGNFLVGVGP